MTAALPAGFYGQNGSGYAISTFDDEDVFLGLLAEADLEYDVIAHVAAKVLCTMYKPIFPQEWVYLDLSAEQCDMLKLSVAGRESKLNSEGELRLETMPIGLIGGTKLDDFLLQAPTPFAMLAGPQHCFNFINEPYVRLLGRLTVDELLGKPVRDALPELEGQPFFRLLDEVYRSGLAFVGVEVPGNLRFEDGIHRDVYFDFIYHPVKSMSGDVVGIMAQAMNVTDRVLSRQVSESREAQLYQQWAELDAIYRNSPVAMALVDANNFTILRSNDRHAALSGRTDAQILGKSIFEIYPGFPDLMDIYREIKSGVSVMDREIVGEVPSSPGVIQRWTANYSPIFSADGTHVVAIACASIEAKERADAQIPSERGLFTAQQAKLHIP